MLSPFVQGVVGRCLVLFKFKSIVAFPEAANTIEVSITASTAQRGILITDTAPGELLFLSLRPGGHGLGLRLYPAGLGLGLEIWLCRDVKATCLIQGSFFSELPQDSLDGCLLILFIITVRKVIVLEGHFIWVLSSKHSQALGKGQDPLLPCVLLPKFDCCLSQKPALLLLQGPGGLPLRTGTLGPWAPLVEVILGRGSWASSFPVLINSHLRC